MTDLSLTIANVHLNIRTAGIITCGDQILICRIQPDVWWFLPGGRIKTGESSRDALQRELAEEIGGSFTILQPLVCSEFFFVKDGIDVHELCTYYDVRVEDPSTLSPQGGREEFRWIARHEVPAFDIKPIFITEYLSKPPSSLELVVSRSKD
jgi:8-oxo-dGTP pyrophosphatase MutT (NUDIX family)